MSKKLNFFLAGIILIEFNVYLSIRKYKDLRVLLGKKLVVLVVLLILTTSKGRGYSFTKFFS